MSSAQGCLACVPVLDSRVDPPASGPEGRGSECTLQFGVVRTGRAGMETDEMQRGCATCQSDSDFNRLRFCAGKLVQLVASVDLVAADLGG